MWRVAFILSLLASPAALAARVPPAYTEAARAHNMPPVILYALALTESGITLSLGRRPWPWTLNIAGHGKRYPSRGAACRALRAALDRTRLIDVGLGQLNVRWQRVLFGDGRRFDDPCAALNPYANLDAAAGILRGCYELEHIDDWIEAAGCYHRPAGGAPAAHYRAAFRDILAQLRSDGNVWIAAANTFYYPTRQSRASRVTWVYPETLIRETRNGLD